ncbi:RNA polymerase sigma factor [Caulobacter segnis]
MNRRPRGRIVDVGSAHDQREEPWRSRNGRAPRKTRGPGVSARCSARATTTIGRICGCFFAPASVPARPSPRTWRSKRFVKLGERPANQEHESPRAFVALGRHQSGARRPSPPEDGLSPRLGLGAGAREPDAAPDAERTVIAKQELGVLNRVVQGLPPRHRRFPADNRVAGLSFAEIARQNGVSEALVRKTVGEAVAACQRASPEGRSIFEDCHVNATVAPGQRHRRPGPGVGSVRVRRAAIGRTRPGARPMAGGRSAPRPGL